MVCYGFAVVQITHGHLGADRVDRRSAKLPELDGASYGSKVLFGRIFGISATHVALTLRPDVPQLPRNVLDSQTPLLSTGYRQQARESGSDAVVQVACDHNCTSPFRPDVTHRMGVASRQ